MPNISEECWQSLITRYGPPLEPDNLDEDTLKLAIAERRALVTVRVSDGCGGGDVYFYRAQMGHYKERAIFVFLRPCEITDEEVAALDYPNPWESDSDIQRFTWRILSLGCWKSLITRYGAPLEPDSLDEDTLKLAIAEKRALKVAEVRNYYLGEYKSGYVLFWRTEVGDTIKGFYMRNGTYFCIAFPQPCEITDNEANILSVPRWKSWEEVCEFTDAILSEGLNSP
ncbi:hypothetical protein APA_5069 [Pseudanabaena sp. lw0831]|nr:hypothetical protein APA_5069 [Pseudanabaena sp. lw0831]